MRKRGNKVIVLRKSCVTGKIVWIYRSESRGAARLAYWRACRAEMERVKNWESRMKQRRDNVNRLIDECLASIPITESLTPEQKCAAKQLRAIGEEEISPYGEFYEHITEERRRREEDKAFRRKNNNNRNYV